MSTPRWWQPPQAVAAAEGHDERRVSWLELFFDLVFVVVIAELTHGLEAHLDPAGLLSFLVLFVPVWWTWIGGTYYDSRFESGDVSYRAAVFLQMLPVAAMALFIHDGLGETGAAFALAYAGGRALLAALYWRGGRHNPPVRALAGRYAAAYAGSALLFGASALLEPPLRYLLWAVALTSDLLTPVLARRLQAQAPRLNASKLPERFGLFVIIVLGEALVAVIGGAAAQEAAGPALLLDLALGMGLTFAIWWVYFDFVARRRPRDGGVGLIWAYLHLPLVMALAAIAAATQYLIAHSDEPLKLFVRLLLGGAFAAAMASIAALEATLAPHPEEPTHLPTSVGLKLAGGALALPLALIPLPAPLLLLGLALLAGVSIVYGVRVWFWR